MPWEERSIMSERLEFVTLALKEGINRSELCRRFGVTRKTGYKWIERYQEEGLAGLVDQSRRPKVSPRRTLEELEERVLEIRGRHPAWGGRKIRSRLLTGGAKAVPSASTITEILRRRGKLSPESPSAQGPWKRFEAERPNDLWQMDFKGHFAMDRGRCHPLTVLDDHSRYALGLEACGDEREATVQERLVEIFRRYGVPDQILADNGPPWGGGTVNGLTHLEVWLVDQGCHVIHGRPKHPQTQGKEERFHRTLKEEVLARGRFEDLGDCQGRFDQWRRIYNLERPHEALGLETPATRYQPSPRAFVETPKPHEYATTDLVRKVDSSGDISYHDTPYFVGKGLRGRYVGLKPTQCDGVFEVYYRHLQVAVVDLQESKP